MALGVAALGLGLPCCDRRAGSALCLGHGLGFSVVDRSARAGGRGLVFGCQGAGGAARRSSVRRLSPLCVACFVPSYACRLRPGSRPAVGCSGAPRWAVALGGLRSVCPVSVANITRGTPNCQALFAKNFSGSPVTPLRGVKKFFRDRNDPALCACVIPYSRRGMGRSSSRAATVARIGPAACAPFGGPFGKLHERLFLGEGGEYIYSTRD